MHSEPEDLVADVVVAAGGRLVSRIRLQKIVYLLGKLGATTGFSFSYHHYGPYSRDLDNAILDAGAFNKVTEDFGNRKSDGARYSVFKNTAETTSYQYSFLRDQKFQDWVKELATVNVTVLELAATAHWLEKEERVADWEEEIIRRKATKTRDGRLLEAVKLLQRLGLEPANLRVSR